MSLQQRLVTHQHLGGARAAGALEELINANFYGESFRDKIGFDNQGASVTYVASDGSKWVIRIEEVE
jgi:hypothetical protein